MDDGFEDDYDRIFSEMDLDNIIAMERASQVEDQSKENDPIPQVLEEFVPPRPPKNHRPNTKHQRPPSLSPIPVFEDDNDYLHFSSRTEPLPGYSGSCTQNRLQTKSGDEMGSLKEVPFKKKFPVAEPVSQSTGAVKKFKFQKSKASTSVSANFTSTPVSVPSQKHISNSKLSQSTPGPAKRTNLNNHNGFVEVVDLEDEDDGFMSNINLDEVVQKHNKPASTNQSVPQSKVERERLHKSQVTSYKSEATVPSAPLNAKPPAPVQNGTTKKFLFQKNKSSSSQALSGQSVSKLMSPRAAPAPASSFSTTRNNVTVGNANALKSASASGSFDSSTTSFEDDEADFLSADELDKIAALESRKVKETSVSAGQKVTLQAKVNQQQPKDFVKLAPAPAPLPSVPKKFQFQKQISTQSQVSTAKPKSTPKEISGNDNLYGFNDGDFISDNELESILELERSAQLRATTESRVAPTAAAASTLPVRKSAETFVRHPFPYPFPPLAGSVAADEEWSKYKERFQTEDRFRTPWFQSIPISGLNISACKRIASVAQDPCQLVQMGSKILFPFLTEITALANSSGEDSITHKFHENYYTDLALLMEKILNRLETEFLAVASSKLTQNAEYRNLLESMFESYIKQSIDLSMTSIPFTLIRLHPPFLDALLFSTVKTGNLSLLHPICCFSQSILHKTLTKLHSGQFMGSPTFNSTSILEQDPDFEVNTNYVSKCRSVAHKLINFLRSHLNPIRFVSLLPHPVQMLFSIELTLSKDPSQCHLIKEEQIALEIFESVNELFEKEGELFAEFMISCLLPLTKTLLRDRQFTWTTVKYRLHPNLWQYLQKTLWQD